MLIISPFFAEDVTIGFWTIILALITAVMGSSVLSALITVLATRKYNAKQVIGLDLKNIGDGAGLAEQLKNKIQGLVLESVQHMQEVNSARAERDAAQLLLKVRDGTIDNLTSQIQEVMIQVGGAQERERQCNMQIQALNDRLDKMTDTEGILGQNLQMKAILRDLRTSGAWQGDENTIG